MWKKLLHIVKSDRERNGEQAELTRRGASSSDDVNVGDKSEDEAPKKPRIDPMFYKVC